MRIKMPAHILAMCLCFGGVAMAQAKQLELERLFADPALSGATPRSLTMAPDGRRVTYLKGQAEDGNRLDLWECHIKAAKHRLLIEADSLVSGAEVLSDEERARRARMRLFASGIISSS